MRWDWLAARVDDDRPLRGLGVVRAVARRGARDQRRGHPPDARARRAGRRQLGGLERYAQVSTAYVAGTHAGRFCECDLDVGQGFNNSYEQSKFESEQLVRSCPDLPFTILRPSIVVGDRNSGWTAAFNVLYWPLRALARGLFPAVPAVASAPGRRRLDRLRRRRDPRAVRVVRRDPADLSPHRRRGREHDRRDRRARERLLPAAAAKAALAGRVPVRRPRSRPVDARGRRHVLPVLLGGDHVRRRVHARAARAGRDQRLAAARLHEPPARLTPPAAAGASARSRGSTRSAALRRRPSRW